MDSAESVTVYNFCTFDLSVKAMRVAHGKAPRELIVARFGGEVLEGTAELVSAADLDAQGLYRRVATGWGDLGP